MRSHIANHTRYGPGPGLNYDPLCLGDRRIDSSQPTDINKAFGIDEVDDHRDFISVPGQHEPGRAAFVIDSNGVPVGVGKGLLGELADVIKPNALPPGLMSRG